MPSPHALLDAAADLAGAALGTAFDLVPSLPVALVLTSVLAGALVAPLTVRSVRAGRRLHSVQPRLADARRLHASDPDGLRRSVLEVFREAGVSPLTPLWLALLQAPVPLALYRAVHGLTHRQADSAAPVHVGGALADAVRAGATRLAGIDLTHSAFDALRGGPVAVAVVSAFAVVVVAVSMLQTRAGRRGAPAVQDERAARIGRVMTRVAPAMALGWGLAVPLVVAISLTTMGVVRAGAVWFAANRPPGA